MRRGWVATAKPPDTSPPSNDDEVAVVDAAESCGDFRIVVTPVQGTFHAIAFADGRVFLDAPGAKYRVR